MFSVFRTLSRELSEDKFSQSELRMIWFIHGNFYLPFDLVSRCLSFIVDGFRGVTVTAEKHDHARVQLASCKSKFAIFSRCYLIERRVS